MRTALLLAAMILAAPAAARDNALAEEYLKLSHESDLNEALVSDGAAQLEASVKEAPCEVVKPILRERNAEVVKYVREKLASADTHARTVAILQSVYSDDELAKLNEFLRSPTGKLMMEKGPQLTRQLQQEMQQRARESLSSAEQLQKKYGTRVDAVRAQCEAQMKGKPAVIPEPPPRK